MKKVVDEQAYRAGLDEAFNQELFKKAVEATTSANEAAENCSKETERLKADLADLQGQEKTDFQTFLQSSGESVDSFLTESQSQVNQVLEDAESKTTEVISEAETATNNANAAATKAETAASQANASAKLANSAAATATSLIEQTNLAIESAGAASDLANANAKEASKAAENANSVIDSVTKKQSELESAVTDAKNTAEETKNLNTTNKNYLTELDTLKKDLNESIKSVDGAVSAANEAADLAVEAAKNVNDIEGAITAHFALGRQKNLELGFKTPLWATSQACTVIKTGDNVNFADLVPASDTDPGVDEYSNFECMQTFDVNAYVDENGYKHITAIKGDKNFDDLNTDVLVCGCSYYEKTWTDDSYFYYSRVFNPTDGYTAPPHCRDIDGNVMPYFLIHKYEGSTIDGTANTEMRSVKNQPPTRRIASYSYGATKFKETKPNGQYYSLMTASEQAWIGLTMLLTGTTKNIQTRWYGAFSYYVQKNCTAALTNTAGVVVPKNVGYILNSSVSVGKLTENQTSMDRNNAWSHSIADSVTVTNITDYDDSNVFLTLDCEPFDSDTDCYVSTMPWRSGFSDLVKGRTGCPGNTPINGKLPVVFMGVELFVGGYEVIGNAFYDIEEQFTRTIYCTNDARKITNTASTALQTYEKGGKMDGNGVQGWRYVCDIGYDPSAGVMWQKTCGQSGSSTGTGYADGVYFDNSTSGQREIAAFGHLGYGTTGGPFCCYASNGLSDVGWFSLGRPSFSACTSR